MSAISIDGKKESQKLQDQLQNFIKDLRNSHIIPGLAVILVGNDPASHFYVGSKVKTCKNLGIHSLKYEKEATISQNELIDLIKDLNQNSKIHGILLQLPLPDHLDEDEILSHIAPEKDVDGFSAINAGKLSLGLEAMVPCTPLGCRIMLKNTLGDLSSLHAVVVGRSNIVGKPMAQLLLKDHCTVTIAHSRTENLKDICLQADILVAAVGRPEMIKGDWIKKNATVIDVGINRVDDPSQDKGYRITGDVAFEEAAQYAGFITPVPGGVGPMTIACLMLNTLICTYRIHGLKVPEDMLKLIP